MRHRASSSESGSQKANSQDAVFNIRTKPPHIFDDITRKLLQLGVTLAVTTFIGLIVRYAVHEFDPSVSTITVTTSRINNNDIASLSVSKHFLERILEFVEESIAIIAAVIPLGFPLCTLVNRYFAKIRAGHSRVEISDDKVLSMIPKYVVIGDGQACQMADSARLRPLVRDTIYQLIKAHLKPKLIVEDSYEEARRLAIRIGLIRREHHRLAVIKSVDLLKNITDARGDIKQSKVRYLLSRMKIMSQSTPADKSLLVYLMKHCEPMPNENLAYLGYSFTDPEAMRAADCAITFADCDDEDVKRSAQVSLKSESTSFTDLYLFLIVCLLSSNITQSYALYQISASVACCVYRFTSITVFQEQIISHSQFTLIVIMHQILAIAALMTKWLSSLPRVPMRSAIAEMSHAATEDSLAASADQPTSAKYRRQSQHKPEASDGFARSTSIPMSRLGSDEEDALSSSSSLASADSSLGGRRRRVKASDSHIHLSGIDMDEAVINSKLVTAYKQTFHNSSLVDDVTYRLAKLHIAYQLLVLTIIIVFGNSMFQLNANNSRQHQSLAFNSLIMNNIFNLANCFNQLGAFNLRGGFRSHPFFVCVLLLAVFIQVTLTELNAFGLENLDPSQWFVCFVFALLSALIAPLTGQQQRGKRQPDQQAARQTPQRQHSHQHEAPRQKRPHRSPGAKSRASPAKVERGKASRVHSISKSQASIVDS